MVQVMKQHSPSSSRAMPLLPLSHSSALNSTPAHSLSPSPSSKRLRLSHTNGSFNYTPSSSSSSSPPSTSSYPPFDSIPSSLAPSSIHRQHSSGTGQVLESSLFDQSVVSPLMGATMWPVMAYPLHSSDSFSSSFTPHPSSDDDFSQQTQQARKAQLASPFTPHIQPGFDSLSPSVSSPPHPLSLASPSHYHGGDFSFSRAPSGQYDDITSLPSYARDQSYNLPSSQDLNSGGMEASYDFSSPSHAQQLPIGTLNRLSSEDAQLSAATAQAEQLASQRSGLGEYSAASNSASAAQGASAAALVPLANYPHIVPPSHKASSSLPSSPATTPPSTPRSPSNQQLRVSKKRHRKTEDDGDRDDGDEKGSVSSAASAHSHSSSAKDRHVNTAVKLLTSNDESGEALMDTKVKQIFYPRPDWPKPHRIRLIEVEDLKSHRRSVYAHGADVGSVVERKSNISRLFGKFTSPNEKLLMNVPGPHNHTVGQESNILTEMGIRRFLDTNKMKGQDHYKAWIFTHLIPRLTIGEPVGEEGHQTPQGKRDGGHHSAASSHHLGVYGATDSPQSLPSSPQSYTSYSSDSYHSSH